MVLNYLFVPAHLFAIYGLPSAILSQIPAGSGPWLGAQGLTAIIRGLSSRSGASAETYVIGCAGRFGVGSSPDRTIPMIYREQVLLDLRRGT